MNETLKQLRLQLGLTQKEFALLLGLKNQETYSRYESGARKIPAELIQVISDKTRIPISDLFKQGKDITYKDKFQLSQHIEELLFKKSMYQIVFSAAEFEGLNATLLDTQELVEGTKLQNISIDDAVVLRDMHRATQYVLANYEEFNFDHLLKLHQISAKNDALNPGSLRTGMGGVNTSKGLFIPPVVNETSEKLWFNSLLLDRMKSATNKSIEIFLHLSRGQIFNDTNKRTALLAANVPLLQGGAGILYINDSMFSHFMKELSIYYDDPNYDVVSKVIYMLGITDFDGKTFYSSDHQANEYGQIHLQLLHAFKAYGAKIFKMSSQEFECAGFDLLTTNQFDRVNLDR